MREGVSSVSPPNHLAFFHRGLLLFLETDVYENAAVCAPRVKNKHCFFSTLSYPLGSRAASRSYNYVVSRHFLPFAETV